MNGKRWPDHKKREVLELYALSGNVMEVHRQCGVPHPTVSRWCKANPEEIERLKERNYGIAEEAIKQTLEERMRDIASFGKEMRLKAQELLRGRMEKLSPGGVASLARAAIEIELRALGEPSEILELRGKALNELLERELARLAKAEEAGSPYDGS